MLIFQLEKDLNTPLYEQLYIGIKNAIINKQIEVGSKLPSKRKLAEFLNISQTTIEIAYAQLLAEGFITSVPRIGFFVEEIDELPYVEKKPLTLPDEAPKKAYKIDFHPGKIDSDTFPFILWRKIAKDLYDEQYKEYVHLGDPQGEYTLRAEISNYLYQSRGIICVPEQIVVGSGTEQLLPMIMRLIGNNSKLAIENPGYSAIPRNLLLNKAFAIPVDDDGLIVDELEKTDATIVYITPSHQFPTGAVLSAARRNQLLHWATNGENRYIIEDDYDSEFRYIGKPIPALQGLDRNDKVIYMSTFTKSLMPSLRVAYFVLPKSLLYSYKQNFGFYSSTVPRFDQYILANFMKEGHFSKHLNRMRKVYRKKHDKLTSTLSIYYPQVKISGDDAGMHILISLPIDKSEEELTKLAANEGIKVYPITDYLLEPISISSPTFLLGFGGIPLEEIESAVHHLMSCWKIDKKGSKRAFED